MPHEKLTFEQELQELSLDFSVSRYLEIRRKYPETNPDGFLFFRPYEDTIGFEYAITLKQELEKFQILQGTFLGMLDGYLDSIDQLCLEMLAAIDTRENIENEIPHAIANGLAIGDALLDFLINITLESISYHKCEIPHSYLLLLRMRTNLLNNKYVSEQTSRQRRKFAARIVAENPDASIRDIAREMGVNHVTLYAWMKDKKFKEIVERTRNFDSEKFFKLVGKILNDK